MHPICMALLVVSQCKIMDDQDAIGGTEKPFGHDDGGPFDSFDDCKANVQEYKETNPNVNGVTWGIVKRNCFAEFNATGFENRKNYKSCIFEGTLQIIHCMKTFTMLNKMILFSIIQVLFRF